MGYYKKPVEDIGPGWSIERKMRSYQDNYVFKYTDISSEEFENIVLRVAERFEEVKAIDFLKDDSIKDDFPGEDVSKNGPCFKVKWCSKDKKGIETEYDWSASFDDWGKITGKFYCYKYGKKFYQFCSEISKEIDDLLVSRGKHLGTMSDFVMQDNDVATEREFHYKSAEKRSFLDKLFNKNATAGFNSEDFNGCHFFVVMSYLKTRGFDEIFTNFIRDVDYKTDYKKYIVEEVSIGGIKDFSADMPFNPSLPVVITIHYKKLIVIPESIKNAKGRPYQEVIDELHSLGLCAKAWGLEDVKLGWFVKENTVEKIYAYEDGKNIMTGLNYDHAYDTDFTVYYHSKKGVNKNR